MPQENIVEIPDGSGNRYRYAYDPSSKTTRYLGPVGDSPPLTEEDFFDLIQTTDIFTAGAGLYQLDLDVEEDGRRVMWIKEKGIPLFSIGLEENEWEMVQKAIRRPGFVPDPIIAFTSKSTLPGGQQFEERWTMEWTTEWGYEMMIFRSYNEQIEPNKIKVRLPLLEKAWKGR